MDTGLAATLMLALVLCVIAVIDARHRVIPDFWNAVLAASGLLGAALDPSRGLAGALLGAGVALGAGAALRQAYALARGRPGLGLGDVKFLAAAGTWIGVAGLPFVLLFASVSGLTLATAAKAAGRPVSAASRIAFGPHLALGLALTWVLRPDATM